MPRALITGAGGYVGSGLVATMQEAGWDIRAAGREHAGHLDVEQVVGDLSAEASLAAEACEGMDTIVHLAGDNEVVAARDPAFALGGTLLATERLVEAIAESDVKRLVYMSTMHVYGERVKPGAVLTEDMRPEPRATYAIARLASEYAAAAIAARGTEVVIFRLTNSLGAPADPAVKRWTLVANDLSRQGALDGRLELRSAGYQWRDFVSLGDVRAIVTAAARSGDGAVPPGTYNLGSGSSITIRDLAGMVQDAFERHTGERPELHTPPADGDPPEPYEVSVEKAAAAGMHAGTPVADAVDETVRFCIEHKEAIGDG